MFRVVAYLNSASFHKIRKGIPWSLSPKLSSAAKVGGAGVFTRRIRMYIVEISGVRENIHPIGHI